VADGGASGAATTTKNRGRNDQQVPYGVWNLVCHGEQGRERVCWSSGRRTAPQRL